MFQGDRRGECCPPESCNGKSAVTRWVSLGLAALLLVLAVGVFINARRPDLPAEVRPEVGYAPPPLVNTGDDGEKHPLPDMNGRPVRLEDYRGKVVFINFWASWCRPCRREMPEIQRLQEQFGDRLKVLAVNATAQDEEAEAREFVRQLGLTFDVLMDRTGEAVEAYQVILFPTTFIVDPGGTIRTRREGAMTYGMMESAVRQAESPFSFSP